jgi:hypothetical protein
MYSLATYQKLSHIRAHELSTAGSRKPGCMLVCVPKIHLCCQVLGAEKKAKDKNNETYNTWQLGSRLPNLFWISIPGKLGLLIRRLLKQVRIEIQQNQNLKKNSEGRIQTYLALLGGSLMVPKLFFTTGCETKTTFLALSWHAS